MKLLFAIPILAILLCTSIEAHVGASKAQPDARPISPDDAVKMALADVLSVPVELRASCRYLSLHNIKPEERFEFTQVLDFVLNSLSRKRSMSWCVPVNGSNGSVVRVVLELYGLTSDGWDNLAAKGSGPIRISTKKDQPEPYFQAKVSKTHTVTKERQMRDSSGKLLFYDVGKPNETPAMEKYTEEIIESASGAWIDPVAIIALQKEIHSSYPILRADWFLGNATLAPSYYDLLGIKTLNDFQELVRYRKADYDLSNKAVVVDSSEVSLHNRAILVTPTSLGNHWETLDHRTSQGGNNLLKDLVKRNRDAGEAFAEMRNGLQAFVLVDDKDKILDVADGAIVTDQTNAWREKLVYGGMAQCTMCHVDGGKSVNDEVRALTKPPIGLLVPLSEKRKIEEVRDLFFSGNIDDPLAITKAVYRQKVLQSSRGLLPEKNTALFRQHFLRFLQSPLNLADACAEVGCTPAEFTGIMSKLQAPAPDVGVTMLLAGRPLRREVWEDGSYQQAATIFYNMRKLKP